MNSGMKFEEGSLEEAAYQPQATPSMIDTPKYYGTSGVLALQKKNKTGTKRKVHGRGRKTHGTYSSENDEETAK